MNDINAKSTATDYDINQQINWQAFPGKTMAFIGNREQEIEVPGMSKREYFAAMAMQGMITAITKFRSEPTMNDIIVHRPVDVAEISVVYADKLLKQLSLP